MSSRVGIYGGGSIFELWSIRLARALPKPRAREPHFMQS